MCLCFLVSVSFGTLLKFCKFSIHINIIDTKLALYHIGIRAIKLGKTGRMAKKVDKQFKSAEHEISGMREEVQKFARY